MRPFFVMLLWLTFFLGVPHAFGGEGFRVLSWNVENLFDLHKDGTEYIGYIPNTGYGWNESTAAIKYGNIARVMAEVKPDVAVLTEVESERALFRLQNALKEMGHTMAHGAITKRRATIRCAVLSRFPVISQKDVKTGPERRPILRVTLDVHGKALVVYANHWKSKGGPESKRLPYARALAADVAKLSSGTDYLFAGDFNADYNEWITFKEDRRLNDTGGITGVNHLLKTMDDGVMVSKEGVKKGQHYDLWMELKASSRWSYNFFGKKGSLDHILLPKSLFDGEGVSYLDHSFSRFAPDWLFHKRAIYRWQRAKRGRGKHLGQGYSDHLPIYADFQVGPFVPSKIKPDEAMAGAGRPPLSTIHIADLYKGPVGPANGRIPEAIVIYKAGSSAVLKEPGGRAIYVYKAADTLAKGDMVSLTVRQVGIYKGLREITALADIKVVGQTEVAPYLLRPGPDTHLRDASFTGEVVASLCGIYRGGWLTYGNGRSIRLYIKKGIKRPRNDTRICIENVRVGHYKGPQLSIEKARQWRRADKDTTN